MATTAHHTTDRSLATLNRPAPIAAPIPRPGLLARARLRFWHAVLSAGTDDVAQLRGWDRLIQWRRYGSAAERLRAVKRVLKLPARATRETYRQVRTFGDELAEQAGVPKARQFRQLWWLAVRHDLSAEAYLNFQLYRPERWRRAGSYVQVGEFFRVGRFIRAHKSREHGRILTDKRLFDGWCRANGFPTTTLLMEFQQGDVTYAAPGARSLPPCDLFSMPSEAAGGHGARRWIYAVSGGCVGSDGRTRQAAELLEELAEMSRSLPRMYGMESRRIMLQKCLRNHRELLPLTPGGLCTVRFQTYRWPDGAPQLLLAVYKMPVGDSAADNFCFGGVIAPVDVATGRIGQPIFRRGRVITTIERHPDTGAAIEGHQIPLWEDAVRLVLRAHAAVGRMAAVGWDVAILDEGPALVEGNTLPSPDLAQEPLGVPLGETPFVRCINAHVRECFGL